MTVNMKNWQTEEANVLASNPAESEAKTTFHRRNLWKLVWPAPWQPLRRVLLSRFRCGHTSIKIENALHEFPRPAFVK